MMKKLWFIAILLFALNTRLMAQTDDLGAIITLDWDNTGSRLALGYEGGNIIVLDTLANTKSSIGILQQTN